MDEESFDEVLGVNLRGTTFMCQLAAKAMLEGKKTLSDYAPRIINIGSMSAYTASASIAESTASAKSALQWVEDFGALLRKANQALKPQGYLCFSTFYLKT